MTATPTTALVIGATGVVGRALVDQLAEADHVDRVVSLTRRPAEHTSPKVTNRVVDFTRLDDFAADFTGDLLFSALGTTKAKAGSIEAQRVVDVDHQLHAARLARAGGVRHLLLVSSPGANSRSRSAYLKMKGDLDEAVADLGFERVSLFQPTLIVGERPEERWLEKTAGAVMSTLGRLPGLGELQPVTGADVAARMVQESRLTGPGHTVITRSEITASRAS